MTDGKKLLHEGEREAQRRFGAEDAWNESALDAMIHDLLSPGFSSFIAAQAFFFIATASAEGDCDCSFRGREVDAQGLFYPLLMVLDEKTLVFPDYMGNKLYNSLGNILTNPHVGMLFVDFQRQARARINGQVEIVEDRAVYADIWPQALRFLRVTVEQAYGNCRARIPRMVMVEPVSVDCS